MTSASTVSGLSFELTDEQQLFQRTIRELTDNEFPKELLPGDRGPGGASPGTCGRSLAKTD